MQATTINKVFWGLAVAGLALLLVTRLDWLQWSSAQLVTDSETTAPPSLASAGGRLAIEGVELVSKRHGVLSMGLVADHFQVRRIDAAPATDPQARVVAADELLMQDARLQLYLDADNAPLGDWAGGAGSDTDPGQVAGVMAGVLSDFPELERVVQWRARPFEVVLYRGADQLLVLRAATAATVVGESRVVFTDVTIEHLPSGRSLSSPELWWDGRVDRLIVPQGYEEHGSGGPVSSGAVSLGLDFVPRPWPEDGGADRPSN